MPELSLHSRRCVLGNTAPRIEAARVVLRDGVIAEVHTGVPEALPGDHALGDKLLTPAFVNSHTHLALHACRGLTAPRSLDGNLVEDVFFRIESHLEPADVLAFSRVAALECLLQGVGTVFDHYYHAPQVAQAVVDCGLAAVIAPTLQDQAGPGASDWEESLQAAVDLDSDEWRAQGVAAAVGPHATDTVSAALWRRALEIAETRGLTLHAHVAQSAEEATRCLQKHNCSPLEWLEREGLLGTDVPQLLVHALFVSDSDLRRLSPAHHTLGANPFSQMQFGFPAPVDEWTAAGLNWFVGTDCGANNDSMDVQKELRLLARQSTFAVTSSTARSALRAAVTPAEVASLEQERQAASSRSSQDPLDLLQRVWAGPGHWHPGLQTGSIAVGARAQLCVWDTDHPAFWPHLDPWRGLAFSGITPALVGVVAAGQWVGEPGNPAACLKKPEVREWFDEAGRRHTALLRRAGVH